MHAKQLGLAAGFPLVARYLAPAGRRGSLIGVFCHPVAVRANAKAKANVKANAKAQTRTTARTAARTTARARATT